MIVKYSTTPGQALTEQEREEIRNAKLLEPQFDDDCPELTPEMLKSLKTAVRNKNHAANLRMVQEILLLTCLRG